MAGWPYLKRLPEVPLEGVAQEDHILDRDGLVQAQVGADGLDLLVGGVARRYEEGGVAGEPGRDEHDQSDPEERDDREQQAAWR